MRTFSLLLTLLLTGCTSLFLQPSGRLYTKPEDHGFRYEGVHFKGDDGTPLTGLFLFSSGTARGTVVHFHGNAENMTSHFLFAAWLTREGFNVFAFDCRGYGASGGKATVPGCVRDGSAALRYVRGRKDVDPERIAVFGQSLGAALAVAAIAREDRRGIRAIVLESPFSSYRSIARDKLGQIWFTWPFQWPLSVALFSDRYDPRKAVRKLEGIPILVVHGLYDTIVPYQEGKKLFDAAREPKQLWTVPNGRHTEAFTRYGEEFRPKLVRFLAEAMP